MDRLLDRAGPYERMTLWIMRPMDCSKVQIAGRKIDTCKPGQFWFICSTGLLQVLYPEARMEFLG